MSEGTKRIRIEHQGGLGLIWMIGWLFTIGYAKLNFWGGIVGIFVWPYFLGDHMATTGVLAP